MAIYTWHAVGDGSLYMTGTWRANDGCQDVLWGQKKLTRTAEKLLECKSTSNVYTCTFSPFPSFTLKVGESRKTELGFWNVGKVQMLLNFTGMSDYQNIAESTALCILVACTSRYSTWISVIHDVLAWLTILTGIYLLCMLELFYIDVHSFYLEGEVFLSSVKFVVTFCTESSHLFAKVSIVLFSGATPCCTFVKPFLCTILTSPVFQHTETVRWDPGFWGCSVHIII